MSQALTRVAKRAQRSDSSKQSASGASVTSMRVLEPPVRYGWSTCVSFELRKGTCLAPEAMAAITSPRLKRLLLMACVSRCRSSHAELSNLLSRPPASLSLSARAPAWRAGGRGGARQAETARSPRGRRG